MVLYIKTPNKSYTETLFSSKPHLEGFYVACAKVSSDKLVYYATTDQEWAELYINLHTLDPIVSLKRKGNDKLSITSWDFNIPSEDHFSFVQRRQTVTKVDFGLTACRSVRKNNTIIHEFYALGTKIGDTDKKDKILQNRFACLAIKDIFDAFSDKI